MLRRIYSVEGSSGQHSGCPPPGDCQDIEEKGGKFTCCSASYSPRSRHVCYKLLSHILAIYVSQLVSLSVLIVYFDCMYSILYVVDAIISEIRCILFVSEFSLPSRTIDKEDYTDTKQFVSSRSFG